MYIRMAPKQHVLHVRKAGVVYKGMSMLEDVVRQGCSIFVYRFLPLMGKSEIMKHSTRSSQCRSTPCTLGPSKRDLADASYLARNIQQVTKHPKPYILSLNTQRSGGSPFYMMLASEP